MVGQHIFLNINPPYSRLELDGKFGVIGAGGMDDHNWHHWFQDLLIGNVACDLANTTLFATTFGEHFDVASRITSLVHDFLHTLI